MYFLIHLLVFFSINVTKHPNAYQIHFLISVRSFGFLALLIRVFFNYTSKYLNTYPILFLINEQSFGFLALLIGVFFVMWLNISTHHILLFFISETWHQEMLFIIIINALFSFSRQNVLLLNTQRKTGHPKTRQNLPQWVQKALFFSHIYIGHIQMKTSNTFQCIVYI